MADPKQAKKSKALCSIGRSDPRILYFGEWVDTKIAFGESSRRCNTPFHACLLPFRGPVVRWLGTKGPDHGLARVYIDGVLAATIDTFAGTAQQPEVLFERADLVGRRVHTIRVVVTRARNRAANNCYQEVTGFECTQAVDYARYLERAASSELSSIRKGTKAFCEPATWDPVSYSAVAPLGGVSLQPGLLLDCFHRNVGYLNECFAAPHYSAAGDNKWVQALPASAEGRLLGGAGHTLRWGERSDMRQIVDTIVTDVHGRQTSDGYCLPYDESYMKAQKVQFVDERRNYDRVNLTRGMLAAGMSGNAEAYETMRSFYDWLNASPYYAGLLSGRFRRSGSNCNNGHAGGLLMYFSPVGKPEDLVAVERNFVQDFFIRQARNAEPLSLGYYPLHTPHSYVLLAFESWFDHYRATGAGKYLEACKGAWRIVRESYEHIGGTIAICEMGPGEYPPQSYHLAKHTGETCGSVFWADFNHRFLQMYPDQEQYAAEIEKVIYNVILAAQDGRGWIRYHNHLHGTKETPQCANTCCEVMGVPFIGRLPQFVYSLADDGVYVNLYAPSNITWTYQGQDVTLAVETEFPWNARMRLQLTLADRTEMAIRLRIPGWAKTDTPVAVNGSVVASGRPGTYLSLDRAWTNGDIITFEPAVGFTVQQYTGLIQDNEHDRFALEYGPVLMALVGGTDLDMASEKLPEALEPIESEPLCYHIAGHPGLKFIPYWQIQSEEFTCFPTMR